MSFIMKGAVMVVLVTISLLIIADHSNGRLLMENSLFVAPYSPSSFDPEKTMLSSRLIPSVQMTDKMESSASSNSEPGFNLLSKGPETPSGPSPKVKSIITEQRLFTSSNNAVVGHMGTIRPESQTIIVDILESRGSHGDDVYERMLRSNPSPGDGN